MQRDIVLILEGGVMLGVFGAGVLTAFDEANIYPRIYIIYSSSAGAHNAAYFLAASRNPAQVRLGSSIYYEDLIGEKFIKPRKIARFAYDLIMSLFIKNHEIAKVVDLDHLINVEQNIKKLDIASIKNQPIPWLVKVFNIDRLKWEYWDGKIDTLKALKASSSAPPFYPYAIKLGKYYCIDEETIPDKNYLEVIEKNKDKIIIYIRNNRKNITSLLSSWPWFIIQSLLFIPLFGWPVAWRKIKSAFNYIFRHQLLSCPHVKLIINDLKYNNRETRKEKLLELYNHGIEKGKKALANL